MSCAWDESNGKCTTTNNYYCPCPNCGPFSCVCGTDGGGTNPANFLRGSWQYRRSYGDYCLVATECNGSWPPQTSWECGTVPYTITVKTTNFDGQVTEVTMGTYTVKESRVEPLPIVESLAFSLPEEQAEPIVTFSASPMPLTSESRFSFTDSYLTGLAETMRQRQMLDLDQSGGLEQKSVSFEDLLWGDDEMFETNWIGLSEQP